MATTALGRGEPTEIAALGRGAVVRTITAILVEHGVPETAITTSGGRADVFGVDAITALELAGEALAEAGLIVKIIRRCRGVTAYAALALPGNARFERFIEDVRGHLIEVLA
ncbi:MAG: hypothetical protein QOD86_2749 [Miltoncostaeaceae bacterium]|jgi:hypothetical protein|nr:hypothetical protein [Miltoncostaeaceae bacterium]